MHRTACYPVDMEHQGCARNAGAVFSLKYHLVFCPKYRKAVLVDRVADRLKALLATKADELHVTLYTLEVMPDHVHLLVNVDPQFGIHRLTKLIKGRSSRFLRQEFPVLKRKLPSLWTNSYFVSTTGGAPLSIIKQYIEQQKHV